MPVLKLPDPEREVLIEVDASEVGIRAVLSPRQGTPEKSYPCAIFSRKLSPVEQNYDTGNHELLAVNGEIRGVATLVGGSETSVHGSHRSHNLDTSDRLKD